MNCAKELPLMSEPHARRWSPVCSLWLRSGDCRPPTVAADRPRIRTAAGVLTILLTISGNCAASSDVAELWTSLSFVTESGDRVEISSAEDHISEISVTLDGKSMMLPSSCFASLGVPVLWGAQLYRSFGIEEGVRSQTVTLKIPIFKEGLSWDDVELFPVAVFHLADQQIWSGALWQDGRMAVQTEALC
jgi:hypothetical protein